MVVMLDSHCYSLVRFSCKLIGLWPYSSTKEQLIKKLSICMLTMVQTIYEYPPQVAGNLYQEQHLKGRLPVRLRHVSVSSYQSTAFFTLLNQLSFRTGHFSKTLDSVHLPERKPKTTAFVKGRQEVESKIGQRFATSANFGSQRIPKSLSFSRIWLLIIASKDVDSVLSILTVILTWIMAETMYLSCLPYYDTIKMLFLCISRDWVELKCTDDLNVLKKYTYDGCSYVTLYSGFTIFSVCLLTVFVIIAAVFQEQFVSLNEHAKQTFPTVAQNMNSIEWSLFIIAFPANSLIVIIVMVAFDSIYMTLIYHACGMLGVMSSRLEHLFDNIQLMNASDRNYLVRARFANVVRYHWKCTDNLYQVIKCFKLNGIALLIIFMTDGIITFVILFARVFPLEKLADGGQLLFQSACNAHWYEASPSIQKSFLFVIQNVSKSYYFGVSGFFNMSFETCNPAIFFFLFHDDVNPANMRIRLTLVFKVSFHSYF
ncbi:unnamed protein product [Xylocopa violacea]|uniref:Odorant receptor n=1 Tax=Xylocopa violacea TaxID=135666 RepID=A0ABP1NFG3_XYLVO